MRKKEESDAVEEILERLRFSIHHSPISEFAISRKMNVQSPSLSKWLAGGAVPNALSLRKFGVSWSAKPRRLNSDLRRCPFCRSRRIRLSRVEMGMKRAQYFAICERCKAQGPPAASEARPRERWNKRGPKRLPE
jgi:ribosomal protein L40E